jgi:carboxyl-terminal processing protease
MRHRMWTSAAVVLVVAACDAGVSEPESSMSPSAAIYLGAALDTMEAYSIRRFEIDWPTFREQAIADANGSLNSFDTYPAIEAALERLGDGHSFFVRPGGFAATTAGASVGRSGSVLAADGRGSDGNAAVAYIEDGAAPTASASGPAAVDPSTALLADGIGYLDVPEFQGGGPDGNELVGTYHELIEHVDTMGVTCRWVVDLRGNLGGNMWPMLAGVGPILGEGTAGSFLYPDSVSTPWFYEGGVAGLSDLTAFSGTESPYTLGSPLPFVAVLTDSFTASSGEAVAVAFRGRDGARAFGEPTWGVSTVNAGYQLADLAVMFLTVATLVDRQGTVYGSTLEPDEVVTGGVKTGDPETDAVLEAAVTWLAAQPCG